MDDAFEILHMLPAGLSSSDSEQDADVDPAGPVLEIDVGMDESEDSEDFCTPYWKTRR